MNKMLYYYEPYEDNQIKLIVVTPDRAIDVMKNYAYQHGYTYANDSDALLEFIALNWVQWVEVEEE